MELHLSDYQCCYFIQEIKINLKFKDMNIKNI